MPEPDRPLPFPTRLWFAWVCFFRVLLDGAFARRAFAAAKPPAELPPAERKAPRALEAKPDAAPAGAERKPVAEPGRAAATATTGALQLLALFQREGRLVDFLEQDVATFADAEVGAAARVVHEGCRRALRSHGKLAPVRAEEEGSKVTLAAGFDPAEVKLSGNVQGSAPYRGTLQHRGWRVAELTLPTPVDGHDPSVIAPAEVEL